MGRQLPEILEILQHNVSGMDDLPDDIESIDQLADEINKLVVGNKVTNVATGKEAVVVNTTCIESTVTAEFDESVEEEKAEGTVTFTGEEETEISEGFTVATEDGIEFETTETVSIEIGETTVDAAIEAVEAGSDGNVEANTITEFVDEDEDLTEVTNAEPTEGGSCGYELVTPDGDNILVVKDVSLQTEANSGTIKLDLACADKKVARLYASANNRHQTLVSSIRGEPGEPLLYRADTGDNEVFVAANFIEIASE